MAAVIRDSDRSFLLVPKTRNFDPFGQICRLVILCVAESNATRGSLRSRWLQPLQAIATQHIAIAAPSSLLWRANSSNHHSQELEAGRERTR
jgi:hypothetical protein